MALKVTTRDFKYKPPLAGFWPLPSNGQSPTPHPRGFSVGIVSMSSGSLGVGEIVRLSTFGDFIQPMKNSDFTNGGQALLLGSVASFTIDDVVKRTISTTDVAIASSQGKEIKAYIYPADEYVFVAKSQFGVFAPGGGANGATTLFSSDSIGVDTQLKISTRKIGSVINSIEVVPPGQESIAGAPVAARPAGMTILGRYNDNDELISQPFVMVKFGESAFSNSR